MPKQRFVVLGHTGFIGSRVLNKLSDDGDCETLGFSIGQIDLANEESAGTLAEVFTAESTVIMSAAIKRQLGDTPDSFLQNTRILVNFAKAVARHPVKRVVYLSSGAVYGEDIENLAITEDTPLVPRSYYGLSKIDAEWILKRAVPSETSLGLLRPATIYGPGDLETAYGPSGFLNAAVRGEPIKLWGDGSELRELLFIDDVVDVVAAFAKSDHSGPLNCVAGKSYSFQDALAAVERVVGRLPEVTSRPRSKDKVDNAYDNRLLRTVLPGISFTPLEDGIRRTFAARYAGTAATTE